jgi:glycosyltransferase involved in cell wall biosynthesis
VSAPAGVSVIVITFNEEENIEECLQSVQWAAEIIVVDSCSADRTVEIAKRFTDQVWTTEWKGYGEAKAYGLARATREWVLWLDADERVTPELAGEIRRIVAQRSAEAGWEVARRAYFIGKWIRHCGWYPGYVVRLFRKEAAQFSTPHVHERVELTGATGRLKNDLLHYTDETIFHYLAKFDRYTTLAAQDLGERRRTTSWYDLLIRPPFMFVKMFFLKKGFLDGMHGFVLSLLSSAYVFMKYAKAWELGKSTTT